MKPLIAVLLFFSPLLYCAQYGNEWIDYSQKYYEIPIIESGIYRIDYTTLSNVLAETGDNLSTIDPRNLQLFGRDQELYIHVEGESDGSFNTTDYILFYAKKNDTWLDSSLFDDPSLIMNRNKSFTSDTIRYFLSWNNSTTNRRIKGETDVDFSSYTAADFCWRTNEVSYSQEYFVGEQYEGLSRSRYESAEGWSSFRFGMGGSHSASLSTANAFYSSSAPAAYVEAVSGGASNSSSLVGFNHKLVVTYTDGSGTAITAKDTVYSGYKVIRSLFSIPNGSLPASTTSIKHKSEDLGQISDYQTVGEVRLTYPHTFNFENASWFEMDIEPSFTASKSLMSITNFNGSNPILWLFSGDTIKQLALVIGGGTTNVLAPNNATASLQHAIMFDDSQIKEVTDYSNSSSTVKITPVMRNGRFRDIASANLGDAYLIITHRSLYPEAIAYGSYRSTNDGGGHDTLVIDVDELYRQFGGGVVKSGLGIRRFCYYAIDNWPTKPANLFLLGKSVMEASEGNASVAASVTYGIVQGTGSEYSKCLVPSIGYPSSDDYFSKSNTDATLEPAIPTGRLSAKLPQDVADYLNKVQAFEQMQDSSSFYGIEEKEWQKKAMHFGGGSTESEQLLLKNYLGNYEYVFENVGKFGGDVDTYLKVSSDPITPVIFDEVNQNLQDGVSLITFFGHASTEGFDQNIDNPDNWGNYGKFPIVIGLGCFAGDVHQPSTTSASEKFVILPDQGAIAFLSTVKIGFTNGLNSFTSEFYNGFCDTLYGESIGKVAQYAKSSLSSTSHVSESGSVGNFSIQGDPAISINAHKAPELVLDQSRIFISPSEITVATDSFDLNIVVTNLGQAIRDTIGIEVVRTFPNGVDSIYFYDLPQGAYRDTVVLSIPLQPTIAEGINLFNIEVDLPSEYAEQHDDFFNNKIVYSTYIQLDGIEPVYPYDYAIVPNKKMTLKASTVDPFAPNRAYRFELDTNDAFTSPFLKNQLISSEGGIVELDPDLWRNSATGVSDTLSFTDSTVYFWRASADSTVPIWKERSFQYINGKIGWGQAHFHQFKNGEFLNIQYNKPARAFELGQSSLILTCNTISNMTNSERKYCNYFIGTDRIDYHTYSNSSYPNIHVCVMDPITLEAWGTPKVLSTGDTLNWERDYGQRNVNFTSRDRPDYFFEFRQSDVSQMSSIESMIDTVPNGHYILIYTIWKAEYSNWDAHAPGLYGKLVSLGFNSFSTSRVNESFILFCRKGDPTSASEVFSQPDSLGIHEPIQLQDSLDFAQSGLMRSTLVGPALKWNTLYWAQMPYELPNTDSTRIKLYGVKHSGVTDLILDTIFSQVDSVVNLDAILDASEYPFAKIEGFYFDGVSQTPAQTNRWQVLYDPAPELAINQKKGFYFSINDSIAHGDSAEFAIAIENVSEFDFDSLLVHYSVQDYNNQRQYIPYARQDSLRAGGVILDTITISTQNLPNDNRLWVEANPYIDDLNQDQREQFYFNNVAFIDFHAETDKINPILDVTFDGLHILNRDIVSAKPFVTITVDDENRFFLFDSQEDTSNLQLFLREPGGTTFKSIRFRDGNGEELLRFIPATGDENKCTIEYEPEFPVDGIYKLLVQAKDKSQNSSGDIEYEIEFEVVNASTITNVMNYPNPFTTRTQFVFTLTGSVIPDYFKIQILTASGRIVREITRAELGDLRIGRNITDYYWDGRDQFGDRLAAGVYFYTVTTKINGENIDRRESGADEYINKEFGKMYLLSY